MSNRNMFTDTISTIEEKEKAIEDYQNRCVYKSKRKIVIRNSLVVFVISIIVVWSISYGTYSYTRYRECMDNNMALILFANNKLELENEYTGYGTTVQLYHLYPNVQIVVEKALGNFTILEDNIGYIKEYENNVLKSIEVKNSMKDFILNINPKVIFSGVKTVGNADVYEVRSKKSCQEMAELVKSKKFNDLYTYHINKMIEENGKIFIN